MTHPNTHDSQVFFVSGDSGVEMITIPPSMLYDIIQRVGYPLALPELESKVVEPEERTAEGLTRPLSIVHPTRQVPDVKYVSSHERKRSVEVPLYAAIPSPAALSLSKELGEASW